MKIKNRLRELGISTLAMLFLYGNTNPIYGNYIKDKEIYSTCQEDANTPKPAPINSPINEDRIDYSGELEQILTPDFLNAIGSVESNDNSHAVSTKGALGKYQIMPGTWKQYEGKLNIKEAFNPIINEKVAKEHLSWLENYCAQNCPYWSHLDVSEKRAILAASYNGGHNGLKFNGWRIWDMPLETREYIFKIENNIGEENIKVPDVTNKPRVRTLPTNYGEPI